MLLDTSEIIVSNSSSIIQFTTEGNDNWKIWDRYLEIEGKKAFHIGNVCETCSFFFERLEGANQSINPNTVVTSLKKGVRNLNQNLLQELAVIVPNGNYKLLLQEIRPFLVKPGEKTDYFIDEQVTLWGIDGFWGMPHFPRAEYYRLKTKTIGKKRGLFEFLIPMFPHNWLQKKQLAEYEKIYDNAEMPSAVSITVLDIKSPASWDGKQTTEKQTINSHWCLAHYLIDGHHKVYAAAKNRRPLTLISFLSVSESISSEKEIIELINTLKKG